MSLHTDILLDFNNMMRDEIGPSGIGREEIDSLRLQLSQIHKGLIDLRRLGQMPFRELPYRDEEALRILEEARLVREEFSEILLLGIGGSLLGGKFLIDSLGGEGLPGVRSVKVSFCNHLDVKLWTRLAEKRDWQRTLLLVISKSGETTETLTSFLFFRRFMKERLGSKIGRHLRVITDPSDNPLRRIAGEEGAKTLEFPSPVGGRFSVLSAAGLFPAACAGVEIRELLAGARRMDERCRQEDPWFNPAMISAALHFLLDTKKKRTIRVLMPYGESLRSYAPWFAQLWAESLGKRHSLVGTEVRAGTTPLVASGPEDQHSQLQLYLEGPLDKTLTFVATESGPHEILQVERLATEAALKESDCPNQTILLGGTTPYAVGQLIALGQVETVYAGELYNVNPFDQPAVGKIKRYTKEFLEGRISKKKNRSFMI